MRRSPPRRPGIAALDAVLGLAVLLVIAGGGYALARATLDSFFFTLGTAVGWPLL